MPYIGIVEDDPIFASELEKKIEGFRDFTQARRWKTAEAYLSYHESGNIRPALLFLDLRLPGMGGLDLLQKLGEAVYDTPIVILTSLASEESVFQALKYGAVGYLLKSELDGLNELIDTVLSGGAVMSPTIAIRVVEMFRKRPRASITAEPVEGDSTLTAREYEVLELLVCGMSAKEAADSLCVSVHTLRVHVKNIYRKLYISNKTELMLKAKDMGLF